MSHTRTIAGLIGPTLAVIGVALVARPGQFLGMTDELTESTALIFMSGVILLTLGVAIVRLHNDWSGLGPILVTGFGWLAILGGLARILAPAELSSFAIGVMSNATAVMAGGVVALAVGAAYIFVSLRARS
jgi:hypothetical protein